MILRPCTGCRRHVANVEAACPFCGAALAVVAVAPHAAPLGRLSRAAVFASAATLAGCWTNAAPPPAQHASPPGPGGAGDSQGGTDPWANQDRASHDATSRSAPGRDAGVGHFAHAPNDAGVATVHAPADAGVATAHVPADAPPLLIHDPEDDLRNNNRRHTCSSPGPGRAPVCMPYGAPPARRRVV